MNFVSKSFKSLFATASLLLLFSFSSYSQSAWKLVSEDTNARVEFELTTCENQDVILFKINNFKSSDQLMTFNVKILQDDQTSVVANLTHQIFVEANEQLETSCAGGLIATEQFLLLPKEYFGYSVEVEVK